MMTTTKKNWPLVFALTMLFLLILPMLVAMLFPHRNIKFQIGGLDFLGMNIFGAENRAKVAGDAWMDEFFPSQQTGTNVKGKWGTLGAGQRLHPWFKADLSGIAGGSNIDSVKMKIYFTTVLANADITCTLYTCATNATEGGVTWDSANRGVLDWTANGGDYDTLIAIFTTNCGWAVDCYYMFKLNSSGTLAFQQWLNGTRNNYGMVGRNDNAGARDFDSNNGTNPDSVIVYYTTGGGITGAKSKIKVK